MDEGWTRWLLEQYAFEFVSLHPEDFKGPLRDKVDVIILAHDAGIPVEGGGRGAGGAGRAGGPPAQAAAAGAAQAAGRGGGRGIARPEYAYTLTQDDLAGF